jgi:IS5 family transposase
MRQLPLLGNQECVIPLAIDPGHPLVRLTQEIDWQLLEEISKERRQLVVKSSRGQQPNYRANCGAVVVRSLKSLDLRSTEDMIRNYLPARYMCDLHNSHYTPDHDTIWEFETMLGEEGLAQFSEHILKMAEGYGFADTKGLCADTTAQEAKIPYPNEVGLMGAFGKSISRSLSTLGAMAGGLKNKIKGKLQDLAQNLRKHRLFSKTKEARLKVGTKMSQITKDLLQDVGQLMEGISKNVAGSKRRAANHMADVYNSMMQLIGQIDHWIKTGWPAPEKIISLFQIDLRSIPRGKIGKDVEFGLKWGINQVRGGYIRLFMMNEMRSADSNYAVEAIREHIRIFGVAPDEYGFDRGGWSESHMEEMKKLGVKRIGVAPKGKEAWKVSKSCEDRIKRERAQVEGKIGTIKHYGFNKPEEKTTPGMKRAARRAELRFNLTRLFRDLTGMTVLQAMAAA